MYIIIYFFPYKSLKNSKSCDAKQVRSWTSAKCGVTTLVVITRPYCCNGH